MRTVYIDEAPVWVEKGCGLRPLTKCPVQVWASQNNIPNNMERTLPWRVEIFLWPEDDLAKKVAQTVQNLCSSCYYGEAFKIKKRGSK